MHKKNINITIFGLILIFTLTIFTGCTSDNLTFYFNEITNSNNQTTEILLKITTNLKEEITIYASDFSIETKNGYKSGYGFRGGNIIEGSIKLKKSQTGYAYLIFKINANDIISSNIIWLGKTITINQQIIISRPKN